MRQKSLGTKILMAAITLALLAYFGVQAARYFTDPLSTTLAYHYAVEESISVSGYVVRDEQVLSNESSGLLQLLREEGERVSAGGTVAAVFADQASLDLQTEIESLTSRIEQLQYAQEAELGVEITQRLDNQIHQSILSYRAALEAGRFQDAEEQGSTLRSQVLKRDYSVSGGEDLTAQLQELQSQRQTLQSQAAGSVRRITAPAAGLYSAVVDGYETVLTPESLTDLTPSALESVTADAAVQSNVGKLVLGETWYYAAVLTAEEAQDLEKAAEREELYLRFAQGVDTDLPVTLESIGPEENGQAVAILSGELYLSQLTLLREQSAQIIFSSVEGIRVPREAVRLVTETTENEDGTVTETTVTGVYCVSGREAEFKPVEVLYSNENFALVEADIASNQELLRLRPGDEVISNARDLYDGKVIG